MVTSCLLSISLITSVSMRRLPALGDDIFGRRKFGCLGPANRPTRQIVAMLLYLRLLQLKAVLQHGGQLTGWAWNAKGNWSLCPRFESPSTPLPTPRRQGDVVPVKGDTYGGRPDSQAAQNDDCSAGVDLGLVCWVPLQLFTALPPTSPWHHRFRKLVNNCVIFTALPHWRLQRLVD